MATDILGYTEVKTQFTTVHSCPTCSPKGLRPEGILRARKTNVFSPHISLQVTCKWCGRAIVSVGVDEDTLRSALDSLPNPNDDTS
jgi:4-hydroxy-3-methylbut-2-en-1-yl diphosphate synthase IspG/GcpE